ncbi:Ubiquinone biosynthesis protein [Mortierella hygrophila]|uniref:4-hydroxy-3-methoxy-5-polyprenylbenzoate decarboxylase n=1 Tax=Mortierella hygrophila TaxID=979708 RepID=A0A9P6JZR7_9FUNG|nr:Ubiquinone biosynthesis protein [Mortierella hygrophila]
MSARIFTRTNPSVLKQCLTRTGATPSLARSAVPCASLFTFRSPLEAPTGKLYEGHIPISPLQRTILAVGSAFTALANPLRGDMVAALGETTSGIFLNRIRDQMLQDPEGRRILRERPVITSETMQLDTLRQLPDGTFGREYVRFLDDQQVSPDTREPVHYVDSEELAYVMQRYRETHDFYHTLTGLPVTVDGEIALKWFEMAQTGLPMTMLSSFFGPLRLSSEERERLFNVYVPWALENGSTGKLLMNVRWEEWMEKPVEDVQRELGVRPCPEV